MPQIYVIAIIFSCVALAVAGVIFWKVVPEESRGLMLGLFLMELPLQPLAFFCVRRPVHHWLTAWFGAHAEYKWSFDYITLFYAPVTEELAKLLPVVLLIGLGHRARLNWRTMIGPIGFGFGIGEGWAIAYLNSLNPELAKYMWYELMPFLGERFMVCFIHGGMTCAGLYFAMSRGRWAAGVLLAMFLHFCLNAPIYFLGPAQLGLGKIAYAVTLQLLVVLALLGSLALLLGGEHAVRLGKTLFGRAQCPQCQEIYDRSLWGFNLGVRRYEKCPKCGRWNVTGEWREGTKGTSVT